MHYRLELHLHQSNFLSMGMRNLSRISMETCALIVEGMSVISSDTLNVMQHFVVNDSGIDLFSSCSHFIYFILNCNKQALASPPWQLQNFDSTLNITFIQSFKHHLSFLFRPFSPHFILSVSLCWFSIGFSPFKSHLIQLFTILSQTLTPVLTKLFFIYFVLPILL